MLLSKSRKDTLWQLVLIIFTQSLYAGVIFMVEGARTELKADSRNLKSLPIDKRAAEIFGRRRIQQAITKRKDETATRIVNKSFAQVQERDLTKHPPVPYNESEHPFIYYQKHGRRLQSSESFYRPLRITFDTSLLDSVYETSSSDDQIRINTIKNSILPQLSSNLSNLLSVVPVYGNMPVISSACFDYVSVNSNYVSDGVPNTDLIVFVQASITMFGQEMCCDTCTTLAAAATCETDQFDRPVSGLVNFCLNQIPLRFGSSSVNSADIEDAISVAEHELTHVLGFHGLMFRFYRNPETGEPLTPRPFCTSIVACTDGTTYSNVIMPSSNTLRMVQSKRGDDFAFEITLPTVRQVARNHYDCQAVTGARLENQPTSAGDCFGSHFEERLSYDEALSAFVPPEGIYYSPFTLALLEDTGWYKANFALAEITPWGHLAGCSFWDIDADCIVNGEIPDYSRGFFCNSLSQADLNTQEIKGDYQCHPDRTHMAVCDLFDMSSLNVESPPSDRSYFPNPDWGPFFHEADYCPIAYHNSINCEVDQNSQSFYNPLPILPGEVYAKGSRCFDTESADRRSQQPACFQMKCVAERQHLEVYINGQTVICDQDFKEIDYPTQEGKTLFICPRLSVVCPDLFCPANCSGNGVCEYNRDLAMASCNCFDPSDTSSSCANSPAALPDPGKSTCDSNIAPVMTSDGDTSEDDNSDGEASSSANGSCLRCVLCLLCMIGSVLSSTY